MNTAKLIRSSQALMLVLALCVAGFAQTPEALLPAQQTQITKTTTRQVQVESTVTAPQVVTILHRLNGLKVIRLLLRGNEQLGALASLDEAFQMAGEVHTNVIAGLALSDGQTIAAWLPEAEAELPPPQLYAAPAPSTPAAAAALQAKPGEYVKAAPQIPSFGPLQFQRSFAAADVKVVMRDGRNLLGRYVGLDGMTGLSVISLSKSNLPKSADALEDSIQAGQHVRLVGPEPVSQATPGAKSDVYVRVGTTEGTVVDVARTATKTIARVTIKSAKISPANIGAVAINDAGEPLGIVTAVAGDEASVLPVALVRSAAGRVIARQASVPRSWLGVRGEPIGKVSFERIVKVGYQAELAKALAEKQQGILLTSVVPGSPAATAELKPGDVILKVNEEMVRNAEDFSRLLQYAPAGSFVNFTVARPGFAASEAFKIKLAESPDPFFGSSLFDVWRFAPPAPSFLLPGIETVAIKAPVARRLGANGGVLIVYVQPNSAAFSAGLRAGDVIESVNGESIVSRSGFGLLKKSTSATVVVVRNKQRVTIAIPPDNK